MDIIDEGTEIVHEMATLNCCWPPGTLSWTNPVPSDGDG